jgi:4-hydroxy-tetrahydrodipicolinate synthase
VPLQTSTDAHGIHGVLVTPFTADRSAIDEDGLRQVVDRVVEGGIGHVVPCGNTGEYGALSTTERRRVIRITVEAARGRANVIAGVGGPLPDLHAAIADAADAGVDAVMVHHPAHPFVTEEGLLAYYTESAARSPVSVIGYVRSPAFGPLALTRLAREPNVVAVKYAVNDLPAFAQTVAASQGQTDVAWICGTAERWAPFFWAAGSVGFTSGLVNVTTGPSREMLGALKLGDRAGAMGVWARVAPFEALRARRADGYNVAVLKEALRQLGCPAGPVRAPSSDVGPQDRDEIGRILLDWGLLPA